MGTEQMGKNRVLRRIFGPNRVGSWRRMHTEELHILHVSSNIMRDSKSKKMRWAGHVTWMEQYEIHAKL
jgi:hypothetical protein